jgi:hypothetical protein
MIASRTPLLALAALSLSAAASLWAQQPAAPAHGNSAPAQPSKPQANAAPAPQGNLIIQVTDDNGTPFPGAAIEVDGMRTGAAPAGAPKPGSAQPNSAQPNSVQPGTVQPAGAQPDPQSSIGQASSFRVYGAETSGPEAGGSGSGGSGSVGAESSEAQVNCTIEGGARPVISQPSPRAGVHSDPAQAAGSPSGQGSSAAPSGSGEAGEAQPGGQQVNTVEPGTVQAVGSHPRLAQPRRAETANAGPGSPQSGNNTPGASSAGSGQAAGAQLEPDDSSPNTFQPGTAQAIHCQSGGAAGGPALPPGVIALITDAQGQLILQLPNGEHTVSVSVYGFEPFTGHFTLSGKHRQMVQIKLSSSPPTYVFVVGPDSRVQLETPEVDALIPLAPLQTLGPLAPRTRRRLL